jgi:hypothetical protein
LVGGSQPNPISELRIREERNIDCWGSIVVQDLQLVSGNDFKTFFNG